MKGLLLLSTLAVCSPVVAQEGMFRGNPQHTGVYGEAGVPQFTKIKWQFHAKGQILSSPTIAGDILYVGCSDHFFYAIHLADGAVAWKFKTESRVASSAAVSAGLVYFGSFDGTFYGLDAATGQVKWKFQTGGERRFAGTHLHGAQPAGETMPDPFDFFLSSPVVWNGVVYFGSGDSNIYALEAASGNLKWKFKTGDVVHASPAIYGDTLFVGSWDSYFYALDAATGREKWRFKTGEDEKIHNQVGIQSSAAVEDGTVYFGCRDSKVYALDAVTGKERWSFSNQGSWVIASPALLDGKVYFATSDSGLFYALEAKSGTPLFSLSFKNWPMFSSPAIAGGMAYIGSHQGKLLAIDLKTQRVAWTFETESSKKNGPAYTTPDGAPNYEAAFADFFYDDMIIGVQKMMSVGAILSSPAVMGGVLYFGSTDGTIYALI
jgi:outer membrane protein assembly factor BamB